MPKEKKTFFRVKEVKPGIFAIASSAVRMYLIVGTESALLVDTGYGFLDPHETIRSITDLPLKVVNSHGHIDHAGGNHFFQSEPVFIHSADLGVWKRHTSEPIRKAGLNGLRAIQRIVFWLPIIPKDLDESRYIQTSDQEERFQSLNEGVSFDLGGMTARIYELPGHTEGSIGVFIPERRLLITSDAANPGTWLFLEESTSLETYRQTLKKISCLDLDWILTGHSSRLYTKENLGEWIRVAENPDWEKGQKQKYNIFSNSTDIRICHERGNRRNRACLWIGLEKL